MQQSFFAYLALSLASTVAAMPGAPLHNLKARTVEEGVSPRAIDWEHGTCGGSTGFSCASGYCCSQYGYCGTDQRYCTGTQPPPGNDNGNSSPQCPGRIIYHGDGNNGWPAQSKWGSFESLWNTNVNTIGISCTQFGQPNNSPTETSQLKAAIQSVASVSGVDARFILAVVMQESKGCVRVWTSNGAHPNPGLMQDHNGRYTCYGVNPCPNDSIVGMIREGTQGTSTGDGLQQILARLNTSGAQKVYQAARIYNSGSLSSDGDLSSGGATSSYPADIANRLLGCVF